jgi:hypothetical protein
MKTKKLIATNTQDPRIAPVQDSNKPSSIYIYGILGGLVLVYFLTKNKK